MILESTGHEAELKPGGVGQFDVEVDGKLVFSKGKTGRFPEPFEVIEQIPSG
jgi:selT/selW/selH-like putative selenoprotein